MKTNTTRRISALLPPKHDLVWLLMSQKGGRRWKIWLACTLISNWIRYRRLLRVFLRLNRVEIIHLINKFYFFQQRFNAFESLLVPAIAWGGVMYAIRRSLYKWELRRIRVLKKSAYEIINTVFYLVYLAAKLACGFLLFVLSRPQIVRQLEPGKFEEVENEYGRPPLR